MTGEDLSFVPAIANRTLLKEIPKRGAPVSTCRLNNNLPGGIALTRNQA